jgi:hypothetical protein
VPELAASAALHHFDGPKWPSSAQQRGQFSGKKAMSFAGNFLFNARPNHPRK